MATCASCSGDLAAGVRWCGICHANTIDPGVGRLASPGRRLAAHAFDHVIPIFSFFGMLSVVGIGAATGSRAGVSFGALVAFCLFVGYIVWALSLFARGTTPGKRVLGMKVVRESGAPAGFGAMLIREWIGKLISAMVFGVGFLWILLDKDRQGWHDKLLTTYVVRS